MNRNRFAKRVAVVAGFFFLCASPALTRAQSSPLSPAPAPRRTSPVARPKKEVRPMDDFAGLQLTDEQKADIDQIHKDMKARMDAVVKDEKLGPEQKDAMLSGYRRMEYSEVFKALTPEQQMEVRSKVLARREAEKQEQQKKQPSQPK